MLDLTHVYWNLIKKIQNKIIRKFCYFLFSPLPIKCLLACFITVTSFTFYTSDKNITDILLVIFIGWFSAATWLHYNDLWDQKIDMINHPMRPLVSGIIDQKTAVKATVASFILAGGSAYILGYQVWIFTLFHLILALIYPFICRLHKVFANFIGAWTVLNPQFLFGPVVEQGIVNEFCIFIFCLYPLSIASQLELDIADMNGDEQIGLKTFVLINGIKKTFFAIGCLILISCFLCFLFFFLKLIDYYFLLAFLVYISLYCLFFFKLVVSTNKHSNYEEFLYIVEYSIRCLILSILLVLTAPIYN